MGRDAVCIVERGVPVYLVNELCSCLNPRMGREGTTGKRQDGGVDTLRKWMDGMSEGMMDGQ